MPRSSQARTNALRSMSGSTVASYLKPVDGYRGELQQKGVAPRDHHKDNIRQMREKQRVNRAKKEEEAHANEGQFKMKRFENVTSVVYQKVEEDAVSDGKRHEFLKKKDRSLRNVVGERSTAEKKPYVSQKVKTKPRVPAASNVTKLAPRSDKNFIRNNAKEVIRKGTAVNRKRSADSNRRSSAVGEVPEYIIKRKEELAEIAEQKRMEEEKRNSNIPDGMVKMSEEDRLKTLEALQENKAKILSELSRFPLIVETQKRIRKKNDLEDKIKELDDAIGIFSKREVYISA